MSKLVVKGATLRCQTGNARQARLRDAGRTQEGVWIVRHSLLTFAARHDRDRGPVGATNASRRAAAR
jgi:hypothetical protein